MLLISIFWTARPEWFFLKNCIEGCLRRRYGLPNKKSRAWWYCLNRHLLCRRSFDTIFFNTLCFQKITQDERFKRSFL